VLLKEIQHRGYTGGSADLKYDFSESRIIGANEHESHFIVGFLHIKTFEIRPDILSTDTRGVTHVNFVLLDLLGYTFAPRYAQSGTVISDF